MPFRLICHKEKFRFRPGLGPVPAGPGSGRIRKFRFRCTPICMYGLSRRSTDLTQEPILEPAQENQNNEFNDETGFVRPTPSSISV